jgi:hypothetical protein
LDANVILPAPLKLGEQEMRDLNEETNTRVAWFSIFSLAVCIGCSVLQLAYLKKFFQRESGGPGLGLGFRVWRGVKLGA